MLEVGGGGGVCPLRFRPHPYFSPPPPKIFDPRLQLLAPRFSDLATPIAVFIVVSWRQKYFRNILFLGLWKWWTCQFSTRCKMDRQLNATKITRLQEANQIHKYLQNYGEKLDMGKHPFILVISI